MKSKLIIPIMTAFGSANSEEDKKAEKSQSNTEKIKDDVPREYKSALEAAENYLEFMTFSEKGLFEQLTSQHGSGYPEDAAQYAINNIEVDYNEQALRSALIYLEFMSMSDNELREQLFSEHGKKFTKQQADYAIKNLP